MKDSTSRRTVRALRRNYARGVYLGYLSAYRTAAREQGIEPVNRSSWLCDMKVRNRLEREGYKHLTGAGLLAFTSCRRPVDAHDAALRVLAQWAPGLWMDLLAARAQLAAAFAHVEPKPRYFRISHHRVPA